MKKQQRRKVRSSHEAGGEQGEWGVWKPTQERATAAEIQNPAGVLAFYGKINASFIVRGGKREKSSV